MPVAILMGDIVMWIVDAWSSGYEPNTLHMEQMALSKAMWIGFCQTFSAVFPSISRFMSTIAAGQIVGLDRPAALEFSFLLSIPTMITATGWDLIKGIRHSHAAGATGLTASHFVMNGQRWTVLLIGTAVSFIVALGAVSWFLYWVRKHGFTIFAVYRILLGGGLLLIEAKYL